MPGARALAVSATALVLVACGQDNRADSFRPPAEKPALTVPGQEAPAEEPPGAEAQAEPRSGEQAGEPAPGGPGTSPSDQPSPSTTTTPPVDAPGNDVAPPPGSPAERFEQTCQEDPEACR